MAANAQPPQREPDEAPLFMDELLAELPDGARVLDLGCGSGSFPYRYEKLRIVAYDQHPLVNATEFPAHVTFKQGTIEDLPFADASFDLVIANFVYEHVRNPRPCLEQAERVLRPGGLFYVSIPRATSLEDRIYRHLFQQQGGHLQRYSLESFLREVYRVTGLKLLAYADWPGGYTYLRGWPHLRQSIYRFLRAVRMILGKNLLARNNYILLFRRESRRGWRRVTHCCSHCGGGSVLPEAFDAAAGSGVWTCPHCQRTNPYVKP
ncbi:MAG: class I SAM-dependent methyltransferase [Candidatus Tectomicrobia bacterium]|nr:class I SAM-dependent methyltransferase [Candidatus Tectomicrobia bacterium]